MFHLLLNTEDGPTTTNVQFVKFGDAVGDANDANSFSLVYLDGESISTVWPGKNYTAWILLC